MTFPPRFRGSLKGPATTEEELSALRNFADVAVVHPLMCLRLNTLGFIEQIRKGNFELAGEYLLMAAMLIEIKSRMLLPVRKSAAPGEAEDPRAELVRRLVEYERMKLAALQVDALPTIGRDFVIAAATIDDTVEKIWPYVHVPDLQAA